MTSPKFPGYTPGAGPVSARGEQLAQTISAWLGAARDVDTLGEYEKLPHPGAEAAIHHQWQEAKKRRVTLRCKFVDLADQLLGHYDAPAESARAKYEAQQVDLRVKRMIAWFRTRKPGDWSPEG